MRLLWAMVSVLAAMFLYVSLRGAPFVPILKSEVRRALDLARLKPGMTVVDLGSGDGRLVLAAARRGCFAYGYELNPLLALYSRLRTRSVRHQVSIVLRDFWRTQLPDTTDVVFVFLAQPFMRKLQNHLQAESTRLNKPLTLVSYGFELPDMTAEAKDGAIFRYTFYPS